MAPFLAVVPMRWTDQDVYRHVNNARAVTLLEEARVRFVFEAAAEDGVAGFPAGLLVVALHVDYRRQIPYHGRGLRVSMTVDDLAAASFRICYAMHEGPAETDPVAVVAWTRMATVDLDAGRPRRLTPDERAFLGRWAA